MFAIAAEKVHRFCEIATNLLDPYWTIQAQNAHGMK